MTSNVSDVQPTKGSPRSMDNRFYSLVAGGARIKFVFYTHYMYTMFQFFTYTVRLLEAFIDLQVPELLTAGPQSSQRICEELGLNNHRGWKFLHSLFLIGLLTQESHELQTDDCDTFSLTAEARYFFLENSHGYFFRDVIAYWRYVASVDVPFIDVLKGAALPDMPKWPPQV
jgi:hypothetical protein